MLQTNTKTQLVNQAELTRTTAFVNRSPIEDWTNSGAPLSAGRPLARVATREINKVDRYDPRAEQAAVLNIQMALIDAESKLNTFANESNKANWDQAARALDNLDSSLNPGQNPLAIPQSRVERKEQISQFKIDRDEDQAKVDELAEIFWTHTGDSDEDKQARYQANLEIIAAYKNLIRDQINLARFFAWDSNFAATKFAPTYLRAAMENSSELFNELNWHKLRSSAAGNTREIATVDFLGRSTWATSLEGLDIEVKKNNEAESPEQEYTTVIRRGLWLHPHSRIAIIVNDFFKSNDSNKANALIQKLDELINLYPAQNTLFATDNSLGIRTGLLDLRQYIVDHGNKSRKEDLEPKVTALQKLIPAANYKYTRRDIEHSKDSRSGTRSVIHTLEANLKDYQEVSARLADIEQVAHMLRAAARKKYLSKRNLEEAEKLINKTLEWAKTPQARVPERTNTKIKLEAFIDALKSVHASQANNPESAASEYYKLARRLSKVAQSKDDLRAQKIATRGKAVARIDSAAGLLKNRLTSIASINQRTKDRLNSLLIDMRDSELCGNAERIADLFKKADYQKVRNIIEEMNTMYLKFDTPEYGFKRAKESFSELYQINNDALHSKLSEEASERFEHLCKLIIADIQNKMKFRLMVIDVDKGADATREFVFVEPKDLTRQSLTRQLGFEYIKEGLSRGIRNSDPRTQFRHWQDSSISIEDLHDQMPQTFFLSKLSPDARSGTPAPRINPKEFPLINHT